MGNLVAPQPRDSVDAAGDYIRAYSCFPPPIFILLITLIEVPTRPMACRSLVATSFQAGFFLYYTLAQGVKPGWFRGCAGCYKEGGGVGPLVFFPPKRMEAWRFISYMFIHSGLGVELLNCQKRSSEYRSCLQPGAPAWKRPCANPPGDATGASSQDLAHRTHLPRRRSSRFVAAPN